MKPKRFHGQKYKKLRSGCARKRELFTDEDFPPDSRSLYFSKQAPSDIEWKRPGDLVDNPKLFEEGAPACGISQGELGNCWFVSACSCIARDSELLERIVPDMKSQDWGGRGRYTGVFHFRFYHFGEWHDVVIDDLLPTRNNRLVFAHSKTKNVFWSALLEKAYAKFYGNYESLIAGLAREALVDMVGGVGERVRVEDVREDADGIKELFTDVCRKFNDRSMMITSIEDNIGGIERELENGLVTGHAYAITDIRQVKIGSGIKAFFKPKYIAMVRLRNPWNRKGWTGPWSDKSEEWKQISKGEKKKLELNFDDNGEFWMSFEDFCKTFSTMDVCNLINTSRFTLKKTWKKCIESGLWSIEKGTCGGCSNNKSTFLNNPQYIFDIPKDGQVLQISLDQEDSRIKRQCGKENEKIGFAIIKADLNRQYRMHDYWKRITTMPFGTSRSVFQKLTLDRGRYILVPSTFESGREGRYHLRVYSEKNINFRVLSEDGPKSGSKYKSATQVFIITAEGFEDRGKCCDVYCIIKCEGREVKTPTCPKTLSPEWNSRATFYRKTPKSDISIEVRIKKTFGDELFGVVRLPGPCESTKKGHKQIEPICLTDKNKKESTRGKLHLQIEHFEESDMDKA